MKFGKTTVNLTAAGCYYCGTLNAPAWVEGIVLPAVVGKRPVSIKLPVCGKCSTEKTRAKNEKIRRENERAKSGRENVG